MDKGVVGKSSGPIGKFLDIPAGTGYVEVVGAPAYEWPNPPPTKEIDFFENEFSLSVWFKTSASNSTILPILERRGGTLQNLRGYTLFLYNGRPGFQLAGAGQVPAPAPAYSNWIVPATPTNDLRDGGWHHLVVSVDRTSPSGGLFFVDGGQVTNYTFDPTPYWGRYLDAAAPLLIGRHMDGYPWRGGIDEVMIFKKVLDAAGAMKLFQAKIMRLCIC